MREKMIMTPGPTAINEEVRKEMANPITNPDLDLRFFDFYKETSESLARLLHTKNEVLILSGEGILGLEAACASLIEPGDKVLCIDNGFFGRGFGNFVDMYGGECEYFSSDYRKPVDILKLEKHLKNNNNYKFATFVHCETPSGILNPVGEISKLLKSYNILTVVDMVSSIGGEDVFIDDWKIDIALGGSQKCLSAPPGLTILSVSEDAWGKILNRENKIIGYYSNLSIWKNWYNKKKFPYTQPINDIKALNKSVKIALADDKLIEKHKRIAKAVRKSIINCGLELYPIKGYSNTVTAFKLPKGINETKIRKHLYNKYHIMIANSLGDLKDVLRIGHMGENCCEEKVYLTLKYLDKTLKEHSVNLKDKLHIQFEKNLD